MDKQRRSDASQGSSDPVAVGCSTTETPRPHDAHLSPKLEKALQAIREAGGTRPWLDSPKKHRQLVEAGLVVEGRCGKLRFAVLAELAEQDQAHVARVDGEPHGTPAVDSQLRSRPAEVRRG